MIKKLFQRDSSNVKNKNNSKDEFELNEKTHRRVSLVFLFINPVVLLFSIFQIIAFSVVAWMIELDYSNNMTYALFLYTTIQPIIIFLIYLYNIWLYKKKKYIECSVLSLIPSLSAVILLNVFIISYLL